MKDMKAGDLWRSRDSDAYRLIIDPNRGLTLWFGPGNQPRLYLSRLFSSSVTRIDFMLGRKWKRVGEVQGV